MTRAPCSCRVCAGVRVHIAREIGPNMPKRRGRQRKKFNDKGVALQRAWH